MSGAWPSWFTRWLGASESSIAEGTGWSLELDWPWPPWMTVLGAAAAVAIVLVLYRRERGQASVVTRLALATLRIAALAVLALMLGGLCISVERMSKPVIALALDTSVSMGIVDTDETGRTTPNRAADDAGEAGASAARLEQAKEFLLGDDAAVLARLSRRHRLNLYSLAAGATRLSSSALDDRAQIGALRPAGEASRLGDAVQGILDDLRGANLSAIVLLTDGVTTAGPALSAAAGEARARNVPLYLVGVGDRKPPRDLELTQVVMEEAVFLHETVLIQCELRQTGLGGREVELRVRAKDAEAPLARTVVRLAGDDETQVAMLAFTAEKPGPFELVVEAQPLDEEQNRENNSQTRNFEVRDDKLRVLLVQGYPNFEYRFLKGVLERDEHVELHAVLQEADAGYAGVDRTVLPSFPSSREEIFAYDVVIFGDVDPDLLGPSALENLAAFVEERGGGLILLAGPRHSPSDYQGTPLEPLWPIELASAVVPGDEQLRAEPGAIEPSELAATSPLLQLSMPGAAPMDWSAMPPLYWWVSAPRTKPAARVLAWVAEPGSSGVRSPLLATQFVGAGQVLFHATDETWRWRLDEYQPLYQRYWAQAVRTMGHGKLRGGGAGVELASERGEYRAGETVRLFARFRDAGKSPSVDQWHVMIERPDGRDEPVVLNRAANARGLFTGQLTAGPAGLYYVRPAQPIAGAEPPSAEFRVRSPVTELERTVMDVKEMKRAAEISGGKFYSLAKANRLPNDLPTGRMVPIEKLPSIPLWNRWPMLAAFVGLLCMEWIVRKRSGML